MKKTVWISAVFSLLFFLGAEEQAVWQLGKHSFSPEGTGIDAAKGVVEFNGTNAFTIPVSVLGDQKDYTIEFEIKRDPRADGKDKDHLIWMDFSDPEKQTGICLRYYPPSYNAVWLHLNDGRIEYRNFLPDAKRFYRYTFVVKDRKLQVFRDGLLLILADTVKPSVKPIRFGEIKTQAVKPYHLRNLKIYNKALFPKGFDPNVSRMRTCTGDQYTIQKANVKDPSLPRILVVGDSISMGYRSYITKHFEGRAYVDYWVGGTWFGKDAVKGENSDPKRGWRGVFSHGPYDVVSWNAMTLHMALSGGVSGAEHAGDDRVSPEEFSGDEIHLGALHSRPEQSAGWHACSGESRERPGCQVQPDCGRRDEKTRNSGSGSVCDCRFPAGNHPEGLGRYGALGQRHFQIVRRCHNPRNGESSCFAPRKKHSVKSRSYFRCFRKIRQIFCEDLKNAKNGV